MCFLFVMLSKIRFFNQKNNECLKGRFFVRHEYLRDDFCTDNGLFVCFMNDLWTLFKQHSSHTQLDLHRRVLENTIFIWHKEHTIVIISLFFLLQVVINLCTISHTHPKISPTWQEISVQRNSTVPHMEDLQLVILNSLSTSTLTTVNLPS